MKKTLSLSILLSLAISLFVPVSGQAQQQVPSEQDDVVRITSSLVQLDAVVTDKDENQITDLTAEDFEVLQDGKPQKISNFSYIGAENTDSSKSVASTNSASKKDKNAPPVPPVRIRPGNGGRILTFVVDNGNCSASFIGMTAAREALEKFVNEQMQPGDMVAIYQTQQGSSTLQQYTSDKTYLLRAARKIRFLPALGCNNTGDFFQAARADYTIKANGEGAKQFESEEDRKRREANEDFTNSNKVVGSIGVLRYIVDGLKRVGGRKVVFFMSDGIPLRNRDRSMNTVEGALRDVTEAANRAGVVFNTIDVRGVFDSSLISAADEILPTATATDKIAAERYESSMNAQSGMSFLAGETGGNFYKNSNKLDVPVRRALNSEKGYYLLAYQPDGNTFDGKEFHKIEIKLKRPDFKVRSRAGFFGIKDEDIRSKKRAKSNDLYEAIAAPIPTSGLSLRLSAYFSNTSAEGNLVRSLVHLDGNEITFVDEPNGVKKAVFDVVAVTLNEKNEVVDEFTNVHTIRVAEANAPLVKQYGLTYTVDVPVKKDGDYTLRIAMRNAESKRLGSVSQIIEIPNLKKGKLFLSGLMVSGVDANGKFTLPTAVKPDNAFSPIVSLSVPAIRRFRAGDVMAYAYTVYNASNPANLKVQARLYRDGQVIMDGQPQPFQPEKQGDMTRINDYGYLRLNPQSQPGDYALQVILSDPQAKQMSSQWVDFEVTR